MTATVPDTRPVSLGSPVRFPPGELVFPSRQFDHETFEDVDYLLSTGACPEGRLEIEAPESRLTCLIRDSLPFLAGLLERSVYSQVPLADVAVRAGQFPEASCRLVRTDLPSVLMAAVHFCKQPALKGSTRLVDPQHVLNVLERARQDAAIAFERGGFRTLLFLYDGKPARLYFGDPEDDPGEGALDERALLYAFAPSAPDTHVEVFTSLRLDPDVDAGRTLTELAAMARPAPPAEVFVHLVNGRQIRHRPFVPPHMVIGRDPKVDLFIDNLAVSRRHARIAWERGHFVIEDLDSANGTRLGGEKIERARFEPGSRVEIGKFVITLEEYSSSPSGPATMMIRRAESPADEYLVGGDEPVRIDRDLILGSNAGVDVRVRGLFVQPVHARLTRSDSGRIYLTCFGKAKVRVNGADLQTATLRVGDTLAIGRSEFRVHRGRPAQE